jgi:hypothetical protein
MAVSRTSREGSFIRGERACNRSDSFASSHPPKWLCKGENILIVGHLLSRLFLHDGAFLRVHLITSFLLFAVIMRFESALCRNVARGAVYCHVYEESPLGNMLFALTCTSTPPSHLGKYVQSKQAALVKSTEDQNCMTNHLTRCATCLLTTPSRNACPQTASAKRPMPCLHTTPAPQSGAIVVQFAPAMGTPLGLVILRLIWTGR